MFDNVNHCITADKTALFNCLRYYSTVSSTVSLIVVRTRRLFQTKKTTNIIDKKNSIEFGGHRRLGCTEGMGCCECWGFER